MKTKILALLAGLFHSLVTSTLAGAAAELQAKEPEIITTASGEGASVEAVITSEATKVLASKGGMFAVFAPELSVELKAFLDREIASGTSGAKPLLDKAVAWLIAEEAKV